MDPAFPVLVGFPGFFMRPGKPAARIQRGNDACTKTHAIFFRHVVDDLVGGQCLFTVGIVQAAASAKEEIIGNFQTFCLLFLPVTADIHQGRSGIVQAVTLGRKPLVLFINQGLCRILHDPVKRRFIHQDQCRHSLKQLPFSISSDDVHEKFLRQPVTVL